MADLGQDVDLIDLISVNLVLEFKRWSLRTLLYLEGAGKGVSFPNPSLHFGPSRDAWFSEPITLC
jgi:hypothetical protein